MDDLTKPQMILLILLVSFVTSLSTVVITISILEQASTPAPRTILQRVIQRVVNEDEETDTVDTIVVKEENLIVEVAEKSSPAVVSIVAAKDLPSIEQFFADPFSGNLFFERREIGRGTGFIVSDDGLIITNKHVVADTTASYTVILNSGKTYTAEILARDPIHDIAIAKINGGPFPTIPLGNSNDIRVGQTVIAIGNALGQFQNTVSVGVISGAERTLAGSPDLQRLLQTDAAINPGNSGGPLLSTAGKVIGINTAIISGAENIGFAVPANIAVRDLQQVLTEKRIAYPFLGVRYVVITEALQAEKNLETNFGVLIVGSENMPGIVPGSPASVAGLREGDSITHIDGTALTPDDSLAEVIQMKNIGDTAILTVLRDNNTLSFTITLSELLHN
jgi:serine protease Do